MTEYEIKDAFDNNGWENVPNHKDFGWVKRKIVQEQRYIAYLGGMEGYPNSFSAVIFEVNEGRMMEECSEHIHTLDKLDQFFDKISNKTN